MSPIPSGRMKRKGLRRAYRLLVELSFPLRRRRQEATRFPRPSARDLCRGPVVPRRGAPPFGLSHSMRFLAAEFSLRVFDRTGERAWATGAVTGDSGRFLPTDPSLSWGLRTSCSGWNRIPRSFAHSILLLDCGNPSSSPGTIRPQLPSQPLQKPVKFLQLTVLNDHSSPPLPVSRSAPSAPVPCCSDSWTSRTLGSSIFSFCSPESLAGVGLSSFCI